MAWENTLLPASFRGILFEVISTVDDIERAVVTHEYPYVDGANVEDMGRTARRISMTAVFYGDDYEIQLQQLMAAIDTPGAAELIHPIFGSMQAQFIRSSIPHDASAPDYTKIALEFSDAALSTPLFDRVLPLQQVDAINQAADDALAAAQDRFVADIGRALNLPAMLRDKLSGDMLSVMDSMRGLCDQLIGARGWLASGLFYLNNPVAFVDDLTSGLVSRLNAIFSPMDLRIGSTGTAQSAGFGNAATVATSGVDAPGSAQAFRADVGGASQTTSYSKGGLGAVWTAPLVQLLQPLLPLTSPATAASIAAAVAADGTVVQPFLVAHVATQQTLVVAGAAAALFALALETPVLAPTEIESVAADVRAVINATIALVRLTYPDIVLSRPVIEPLKRLALTVSDCAEMLIRARPPLIDRVVGTPGNLQLLAHLWYGDYRRADELLRLNPLVRNPNLIANGAVFRVYAV